MKFTLLSVVVAVLITQAIAFETEETQRSERLLNNHWANEGQFPFQVAVRAESPTTGALTICSGALISSTFVLSSARCAVRSQAFNLRFFAVTHYTGGSSQTSFDVTIHPRYNSRNNTNDVALIRIPRPLNMNSHQAVRLPNTQWQNLTGRVSLLTAWGRDLSGDFSPVLQYTYTIIESTNALFCRHLWQQDNEHSENTNVICANVLDLNSPRHRFCSGDSGSPLLVQDNRNLVLVGLGIFNAHEDHCRNSTNLFTRISDVRRWITEVARV